ncbi:hypothetical protein SlGVgp014 [Spodoptera litura granulovirus]|uniref:CCHC-type domain-containing protein n=1 Tax=Spodoptera litura granulovirus TaxID=359919 RepID=A5IZL6_9BBAC|nr:hypothetical protein SlGVgp014 [Spodoptera litura granulovirus]ABQ51957.1 hypothetical protein SlGVgp014 [Spodoptera litura granulovirus]
MKSVVYKKCFRCGEEFHNISKCPAKNVTCVYCKKIGHFMSMCFYLQSPNNCYQYKKEGVTFRVYEGVIECYGRDKKLIIRERLSELSYLLQELRIAKITRDVNGLCIEKM